MEALLADIPLLLKDDIRRPVIKELQNPNSFLSGIYRLNGRPFDEKDVLTPEMIDWIVSELKSKQVAMTYELVR